MSQPTAIQVIEDGRVMVVTDLHGDWDAYERARDIFEAGQADRTIDHLVLCGDLIHKPHPGGPDDASLKIILDVMALQTIFSPEAVIVLCGNHEFPHIYGQPLHRGDVNMTAAFEQAMSASGRREEIIDFLSGLPFYVMTSSGVLLSHAGPSEVVVTERAAQTIADFDHRQYREKIDQELSRYDIAHARSVYAAQYGLSYSEMAATLLGADHESDPHYDHLLRAFVFQGDETYSLLWGMLFTQNELSLPNDMRRVVQYGEMVEDFLAAISSTVPAYPQNIVVSGHIATRGGHTVVDDYHLRIASSAHAKPREAGEYLLFDAADSYADADDLVPLLKNVYE